MKVKSSCDLKWYGFWLHLNENKQPVHMRYHFFLHYGWFLQNLEKDFISTLLLHQNCFISSLTFTNLQLRHFLAWKTLSLLQDSNNRQKSYRLGFLLFFLWLFFLWWWRGNDVLFVPRQEDKSRGNDFRYILMLRNF